MKGVGRQANSCHFFFGNLSACGILALIETATDGQSLRGRSGGDEVYHRLVVAQWLSAPVGGDEGKEAMLDLVPFARARREMANGDQESRRIRHRLQFQLPQAQAIAVAAPAVRRDEQPGGLRVQAPPLMAPPAFDGRHRKCGRVMVGAHIDKAPVERRIVDAVRIGTRQRWAGKVVPVHSFGFFCPAPLAAFIFSNSLAVWRDFFGDRR